MPVDFGIFWIFWIPERRGVAVFWLNWLTLEDSGKSGKISKKKKYVSPISSWLRNILEILDSGEWGCRRILLELVDSGKFWKIWKNFKKKEACLADLQLTLEHSGDSEFRRGGCRRILLELVDSGRFLKIWKISTTTKNVCLADLQLTLEHYGDSGFRRVGVSPYSGWIGWLWKILENLENFQKK